MPLIPVDPSLDHSRREWMPPYAITVQAVTTILLSIRLISRIHRAGGRVGFDDVLISLGWVFGLTLTILVVLSTEKYGMDRHIWDVDTTLWPTGALLAWIIEILFLLSTCMTKLSVLMFYRRLVAGTCSRKFKWAVWIAMSIVIAMSITFIVLLLVSCAPITAIWERYNVIHPPKNYKCSSDGQTVSLAKLAGSLSVITDFYSVMLPAALLLRIRITKRQRYGLMFIFGLGYIVVGAGVVRTIYLAKATSPIFDKSWYLFDVYATSVAECNIAIVCACAPSLKSVTGRFFRNISSLSGSKNTDSANGGGSRDFKKGLEPSYGTDTTISAAGTKRESVVSSAGYMFRNLSLRKQKRSANLEAPDRVVELSSFTETHEYGLNCLTPVIQGYDDKPPCTRLESPSPPSLSEEESTFGQPIINIRNIGPATSLSSHPPNHQDTRPTPSANISVQPAPAAATANLAAGSHLRPVQQPLSQPFHNPQSPELSPPPSFIFFPDDNDERALVRVRYRSFVSSSSEENLNLSFHAMNPSATTPEPLRDERKPAQGQQTQIHSDGNLKEQQSQGSQHSQQPEIRQARQASFKPGPVRAAHLQMQSPTPAQQRLRGFGAPRATVDQRRADRNSISRMDSPSPSDTSDDEDDGAEPNFIFNDAVAVTTEDGMSLNASGANNPASTVGIALERPHTSPRIGHSSPPREESPKPPAPATLYSYTPTLRPRRSDPLLSRQNRASIVTGPLTPLAPHAISGTPPPQAMWPLVGGSAVVGGGSPGPTVRDYSHPVAVPWAPDHGAGPGDFPVGVFAERDSTENVHVRSASDATNGGSPRTWAQETFGQDVPGIGRPRLRRVLSREKWGSDGQKKK